MKNFSANAMNDDELDTVVGGAVVSVASDVSQELALENDVSKLIHALGISQEDFNNMALATQQSLLRQFNLTKAALSNVTGTTNILAHNINTKR